MPTNRKMQNAIRELPHRFQRHPFEEGEFKRCKLCLQHGESASHIEALAKDGVPRPNRYKYDEAKASFPRMQANKYTVYGVSNLHHFGGLGPSAR
jgi:hypothetical protein